jgi:hypothetical protein
MKLGPFLEVPVGGKLQDVRNRRSTDPAEV